MKDFSVFSFQFSVVLAFMKIYLGQNPGQKCFYIVFSFLKSENHRFFAYNRVGG